MQVLKEHCVTKFLPTCTTTRGVESSVKDAAHSKSTSRDESISSLLTMLRFCVVSKIDMKKEDPAFVNRIRRKENAKERLYGKCYVKNMIDHLLTCFPNEFDENDVKFFKT